jgi:16S rRNA (guanine(1405)-N(7))-methyltransferase
MTQPTLQPPIERLIALVRQSGKYAGISEEVIRRIGLRQLGSHRSLKDAVDATKSKLHQVAGAYLDRRPPYAAWLESLRMGRAGGTESFQAACHAVLAREHASTRERADLLPTFYHRLLADLPPIRTLLDIGCGLNPLALPWMPLAPEAVYHAYDIHTDLIAFLAEFFEIAGVPGAAHLSDAVGAPPEQPADVALVLKVLPVLEQQDRTASLALLRALNAPVLIVSYPTRTLGGRDKGMAANYEAHFHALVNEEPWQVETFSFPNELCFLVTKPRSE